MKKLSFLLAILATASMCLASCGGESTDTTTDANNTAGTTTAATTTKASVTNPLDNNTPDTTPEFVGPELLDGSKFALDGDLSEYAGLHTVEVIGEKAAANEEKDYTHKKVTFYGAMTDTGLYLACDAYHDVYIGNGTGDWWTNSNFEIFIGASNAQKYVYARGIDAECETSGDDVTAIMVTEELTDGPTVYHTITEMFIPTDYLSDSDIMYNTMDVGVAWKTIGDVIIGGAAHVGPDGEDEYWVPKGTWPNGTKPIVAPSGIWLPDDFSFDEAAE
ncbi:MAG: hypothetical protein IJX47_00965 [Clostridia bacterium]|nr:hypothetical protein [Clostridia bacterium]